MSRHRHQYGCPCEGCRARRLEMWSTGSPRELEVLDAFQAELYWRKPVTFEAARGIGHAGVYIAVANGRPTYVGIAAGQTIGRRWRERSKTAAMMELSDAARKQYLVHAATINALPGHPESPRTTQGRRNLYESVERGLIRYIDKHVRRGKLVNARATRPFVVGSAGVRIVNHGPYPTFLPKRIDVAAGRTLELAFG